MEKEKKKESKFLIITLIIITVTITILIMIIIMTVIKKTYFKIVFSKLGRTKSFKFDLRYIKEKLLFALQTKQKFGGIWLQHIVTMLMKCTFGHKLRVFGRISAQYELKCVLFFFLKMEEFHPNLGLYLSIKMF